jgi:hypothetical protein
MFELLITTETPKAGHERAEYFDSVEAGDRRRSFLKSIEVVDSSNTYRLNPCDRARSPRLRHRRTY